MKPNTTDNDNHTTTKRQPTTMNAARELLREAYDFMEFPDSDVRRLAALLPYAEESGTDADTLAREFIKMSTTERAALCKVMAMERMMLTTHDYEMLRDLIMTQQDQIAALQAEVKALRQQLAGKGQG